MADAQLCRVSGWASSMASRRRERQAWCRLASSIGKSTNSAKTNWKYVNWFLRFTPSVAWIGKDLCIPYLDPTLRKVPSLVVTKNSSWQSDLASLKRYWYWGSRKFIRTLFTPLQYSLLRICLYTELSVTLTCKFDRRFSGLSSRRSTQDRTEPGLTFKIEFSFA